jgi:hypothetical protein
MPTQRFRPERAAFRCNFAGSIVPLSAAPPRLRLRRLLAAAGVVALLAAPGCGTDSETEAPAEKPVAVAPSGELATLSFEAVVYVEPSANHITVLDRVRHELRSAFSALQLRHITLSQKGQVDVDLKRLSREPVTVVDPVTKAVRPGVRVHYRFLGLALVPKELARSGDALLGLLHRDDAAHAAGVIETCTSPATRGSVAVKEPWRAFDPGLEPCARAIDAEQSKIDEARAGLEHPDREIVPIEQERLYLPVVLHVRRRGAKSAPRGASADDPAGRSPAVAAGPAGPEGSAHAVGSATKPGDTPSGDGTPSAASGRGGGDPAFDPAAILAERRNARLLAKLKEKEKDRSDEDDVDDAALSRRTAGGSPAGEGGPRAPFLGYGSAAADAQPRNYALLWFASIAVVILLGTEIRRRLLRRGSRRPRPRR